MAENKQKKHVGKKANGSQHYNIDVVETEDASTSSTTISSSNFMNRITSLPVVSDSVATVTSYVKSAPYGEFVIDKSFNTFSTVQKYAQPYVVPLQPTLGKVDQLAVKALDNIEQKFPVVKQPTSQIIDTVTKPPLHIYAEVRKTVETKVTEPATQAATTLAKGVNQRASILVDGVERVVDRFLPTDGISKTTTSNDESLNQVMRLYDITASLPTRVTTLVNAQLDHHHIPHTTEDFIKLRDANALLREATARIESLHNQLNYWLAVSKKLATEEIPSKINQKVEEARTKVVAGFDTTITAVTANEKVQYYTQELLSAIDKAAEYAKLHGPTLPDYVKIRIDPFLAFVSNQYQLVAIELKSDALPSVKAKNVLNLTQKQVLPVMQKALDEITDNIRNYQQRYLTESERVLDGFKSSLKGFGVPVK